MILIKKTKIEKLAERLAEEAGKYNKAKDKYKLEERVETIRAWERIRGIILAADTLGISGSLIWNSTGDHIWVVEVGQQSVIVPQKGEKQ